MRLPKKWNITYILATYRFVEGVVCFDFWYIVNLNLTADAAFLPAVNTTSQPVNLSRTVSQVVYTTGELGVTRNFPNFDLHL